MIYERLPDYFSKEETEQIIQQKKKSYQKQVALLLLAKIPKKI